MRSRFLTAVLLCLLFALCAAQSTPAAAQKLNAEVDAVFRKMNTSTSPGCALSIIRNHKIVYERGYGTADLSHNIPITPTTVFNVGSMSKQFTAASILLLVHEGKLSLDDPVRKYIPELPDFGTPITIRELLHHTSGLRDGWELLELSGWRLGRCGASVAANLAEGCGRSGDAELSRFCSIAMGSASELEYFLLLAMDLKLLPANDYDRVAQQTAEVKRMLAGFLHKLNAAR